MITAINDRYPDLFVGLDYKTARGVVEESLFWCVGDYPTYEEVRAARASISGNRDDPQVNGKVLYLASDLRAWDEGKDA